jgi:hypothetical protein
VARSTPDMLTLQAILLTSSLLMVSGMVASLMWLAALRVRADQDAVPVDGTDAHLDSPA